MRKTMSKVLACVLVLSAVMACTKIKTGQNGNFVLTLLEDYGVFVETKAVTSAADDYYIEIRNSQGVVASGPYSQFKSGVELSAGADYSVTAQNISPDAALEGRGSVRLYGGSSFAITPDVQVAVKCTCTVANARVTVGYDDSFTAMFKDVTVTVTENSDNSRVFNFDKTSTHDNQELYTYFNIDSDPKANVSIVATLQDGSVKNYSEELALAAGQWSKITLKSNFVGGQGGIEISVDSDPIQKDEDIAVDPTKILTLSLPEQSDANVYARYFIPTLITDANKEEHISSNADVVMGGIVYEVSGDNGGTWTPISTASDGTKVFKGLTPGTKYQFRARYSIVVSNIVEFTTETETQLANSSFEQNSSSKRYDAWITGADINTYSFTSWNTNNDSSIPSGVNGNITFWTHDAVVKTVATASKGGAAVELATRGFRTSTPSGISVGTWSRSEVYEDGDRKLIIGSLSTTQSDASRASSFTFDYKFSSYNNDSFVAKAVLLDASSNQIAVAEFTSSTSKDAFTSQSVEFNYSRTDVKPASIVVTFVSGKGTDYWSYTKRYDGSHNASPYPNDQIRGSVLTIDNVTLNYSDYE